MYCFYVNDRKIFSDQCFSVYDFLKFLDFNLDIVVIEHNKIILPQNLWKRVLIKANDEIEFVTVVGGG